MPSPKAMEPLPFKRTDFCKPDCTCARGGELLCLKLLPDIFDWWNDSDLNRVSIPDDGDLVLMLNRLWLETRSLRAYHAAQAADDAWSAELHRLFGSRAGDVRYTPQGSGEPGSELRRLHTSFREKSEAWGQIMRGGA